MTNEINDIVNRCRDCIGFLDRIRLDDEQRGAQEIAATKNALADAAAEIERLRAITTTN